MPSDIPIGHPMKIRVPINQERLRANMARTRASIDQKLLRENMDLTRELGRWLKRADIPETGIAVDLADIVHAARLTHKHLKAVIKLDPRKPAEASQAAELFGRLYSYLTGEAKHHIREMERAWPAFEKRLGALESGRKKRTVKRIHTK